MQPNQQNPYDFITQAPQKKRGSLLGGGNSQKDRIIRIAIVGLIVIVGGLVLLTIISNSNKANSDSIYKIAAAQLDIIDITATGKTNIRDDKLATQNATTNTVITSQNYETTKYLTSVGGKKIDNKITPLRVTTFKKTLDDALKNGNYDTVFTALLANRIDDYRIKLRAAYSATKDLNLQKQLSDDYQQLEVLFPAIKTT